MADEQRAVLPLASLGMAGANSHPRSAAEMPGVCRGVFGTRHRPRYVHFNSRAPSPDSYRALPSLACVANMETFEKAIRPECRP
jgi:hypothetical protein